LVTIIEANMVIIIKIGVKRYQYIAYLEPDFHSGSGSKGGIPIFHLYHMPEPDLCERKLIWM
jgi:hypothetical protein